MKVDFDKISGEPEDWNAWSNVYMAQISALGCEDVLTTPAAQHGVRGQRRWHGVHGQRRQEVAPPEMSLLSRSSHTGELPGEVKGRAEAYHRRKEGGWDARYNLRG